MTRGLLLGLLVVAALASGPSAAPAGAQRNCGIEPIKPIPPLGCDDLVAQCVCTRDGCRWEWVCVRE